jgi:hypothetical protein
MICEQCKKNRLKVMLEEKDKAMKKYTEKLRKEKYGKKR